MFWILLATCACQQTPPAAVAPPAARPRPQALTGRMVDHAGAPVSNAAVLACSSGYCQDAKTRSDGRFRFEVKRPVTLVLKADGVVAGPGRRAAALLPGIAAGAAPVDVGDLVAPDLAPPVRLPGPDEGPRPLPLGDGLVLTLDRAALRAPVHTFLYEAAARRLPAGREGAFQAVLDEPIVGVFVVEPFGTTSAAPIPVSVPTDLEEGQGVHFRTFSGVDGALSAPAAGRVEGGFARTDPGVGVAELSYLVITSTNPP